MDTLNGHRRLRALIVGGALAVALAMPLAVSADTTGGSIIQPAFSRGATITLDAVHFKSKLIATVDISFTCDPLLVYDWETGTYTTTTAGQVEEAIAVIVQGSGRSIASASGDAFGGDALCDGSHVNTLSIPVVASMAPWKSGAAAAGASVSVADATFSSSHYASSGAVTVKLGK
jgi:hypothetical protein